MNNRCRSAPLAGQRSHVFPCSKTQRSTSSRLFTRNRTRSAPHRSTLITSNLGFSEWASFLKNPHLTSALVDRLTESSHVFNMKECVTLRTKMPAEP